MFQYFRCPWLRWISSLWKLVLASTRIISPADKPEMRTRRSSAADHFSRSQIFGIHHKTPAKVRVYLALRFPQCSFEFVGTICEWCVNSPIDSITSRHPCCHFEIIQTISRGYGSERKAQLACQTCVYLRSARFLHSSGTQYLPKRPPLISQHLVPLPIAMMRTVLF